MQYFFFSSLQTGSTALFFASQQGHHDVVKLLFEFGASTEFQTKVCCGAENDSEWQPLLHWVWWGVLPCYHLRWWFITWRCSDRNDVHHIKLGLLFFFLNLWGTFLCVFVAGRRHSSHRCLSVWTLQGGGHPAEEWSQCSRPAECERLLHLQPLVKLLSVLPRGPVLNLVVWWLIAHNVPAAGI